MKNKQFLMLACILAGILFFAGDVGAQKLIPGGKPYEVQMEGFKDIFCRDLTKILRACKGIETKSEDGEPKFIIQSDMKILASIDANINASSTSQNFYIYKGDLDKNGHDEIVIVDLAGTTNGIGISTYDVHIFQGNQKSGFQEKFRFPVEEFGEKGNFIFDKSLNETLILITYWDWFENLDPKRGDGFYLVEKWFRYQKGRLQPVFNKPTLARRYLISFEKLRRETYDHPDIPYIWLKSANTHKIFVEPKENDKFIETTFGIIKSFDEGEFTIQTNSNEVVKYSLGCCPADYDQTHRITIAEFGILPQKFIYPMNFSNDFSPLMIFKKVDGKKVKMETYQTKYDLKYIKLWFLGAMNDSNKEIVIIAGPNGAGKTTFARAFLQEYDYEFLNADEIAKSLSAENPGEKKISAGKIFFQKLNESIKRNKSLLIETTLSGRYLQKFIENLPNQNYRIRLIFLFVETPEILIERIAERVKKGGHFVPDEDVRRRLVRGKENFRRVYKDLADEWFLYYNMGDNFQIIAAGEKNKIVVIDDNLFKRFQNES